MNDSDPLPESVRRVEPTWPVLAEQQFGGVGTGSKQGSPLSLGDIYFTLFRHKRKIILCGLAGIVGAAAFFYLKPRIYQSEARLFIHYILQNQGPITVGDQGNLRSPDQRGETIINSELQILTSHDLALSVVDRVGAETVLGGTTGEGNDRDIAARVVQKNLLVDVPGKSSVISLVFQHRDPTVVQPVLRAIVDSYLERQIGIHGGGGIVEDALVQETDKLRARLGETEDALAQAKIRAGIVSLEDAKVEIDAQKSELSRKIRESEAEFAKRQATLEQFTRNRSGESTAAPSDSYAPNRVADEYRQVVVRLEFYREQLQNLMVQFTPENARVAGLQQAIAETEQRKQELESQYPELVSQPVALGNRLSRPAGVFDSDLESAQLVGLQSEINVLKRQLEEVLAREARIKEAEPEILKLERKRALDEQNFRRVSENLEQVRIDKNLSAGRVSNISRIQEPSPPYNDSSKTMKVAVAVLLAGIGFGIAWAFAIELYFDRSVRRPSDVEKKLGIPLFLSVPDARRGRLRKQVRAHRKKHRKEKAGKNAGGVMNGASPAQSSGSSHALSLPVIDDPLRPFYETLRDRLIESFENRNLNHKPKLVGLSGLDSKSGVTTAASALASSLSETGEGNVLLVDLTVGQGAAQQFFKGKPVCGLDDVLEARNSAQVQDHLYVVSGNANGTGLSRALPQRFSQLIPKLKASDFDYIIFDMPTVSQISITPRLAGFMDMVLLVLESEKTDQDVVQRAASLLSSSGAHVGAVLNKTRNYVPRSLHQEYLDEN